MTKHAKVDLREFADFDDLYQDRPLPPRVRALTDAKILTFDIETSETVAKTHPTRDVNIRIDQLLAEAHLIAWAGKRYEDKGTMFHHVHGDGLIPMLERLAEELDRADIVQGWNSKQFDHRWVNGVLARYGISPVSPFVTVDLMKTARRVFRLPSNKLDFVANVFAGQRKDGITSSDWDRYIAADEKAIAKVERYNRRDVIVTEAAGDRMRPWLVGFPPLGRWADSPFVCPRCGSPRIEDNGLDYTRPSRPRLFKCKRCGSYARAQGNELRAVES